MTRHITQNSQNRRHSEAVVTLAQQGGSVPAFLSASDDKTIGKWSPDGEWIGLLQPGADYGIVDMHSCSAVNDLIAAACSDGCIRLLTPNGKEEKKVVASSSGAAITSVRWAHDGSAFASASEDGAVKVWSRSGMLRTTLAQLSRCVYAVRWGADSTSLLYAAGNELHIASVQGDTAGNNPKGTSWKAHDGVVLVCDWSGVHGRIVSGGEDGRYRVWDPLGRLLFSSSQAEQPITSVCWSPSGSHFVVGGFRSLRLCAKGGWCAVRESVPGGSVLATAWSQEGTTFAAGLGDGGVAFCSVLDRVETLGALTVRQSEPNRLVIRDCSPGGGRPSAQPTAGVEVVTEEVAFRDRITDYALAEGHVVVLTPSVAHVVSRGAWHAPHAIDLRAPAQLLVTSARGFLVADAAGNANAFGYDGRSLATFKMPGLRPDLLPANLASLAPDCVAYLDRADDKTVRMLDLRTGRQLGSGPYVHPTPVSSMALSQGAFGGLAERSLALVDSSNALYIVRPNRQAAVPGQAAPPAWQATKLAPVCDGALWCAGSDCLLALVDGDMHCWLAASGVEGDAELAAMAKCVGQGAGQALGPMPTLLNCTAGRLTAMKADGTVVHSKAPGSHMPSLAYDAVAQGKWEEAVRLCRFAKSAPLWAALACWSLGGGGRHLDTAVVALAALGAMDRLEFVAHIKTRPLAEERAAELAVYRHAPDEAEAVLLQAGLRMRAIKLNIKLGRWIRAMELAKAGRVHMDTVLVYRQRYLQAVAGPGRPPGPETLEPFRQAQASAQGLDWNSIKAARRAEKSREAAPLLSRQGNPAFGTEGKDMG